MRLKNISGVTGSLLFLSILAVFSGLLKKKSPTKGWDSPTLLSGFSYISIIMYKSAWKQEYIILGDYSLLRLLAESEDTLDEFLHRIIALLWIDNRSVLARTGILSTLLLLVLRSCALSLLLVLLSATLLLLGNASASAIASRTNIVLIAWALVAVRLLMALLLAVFIVALLIVVAALVVIAILLLAILSIVLRSLFLTLVRLVWLALVRSLVAVFLSSALGAGLALALAVVVIIVAAISAAISAAVVSALLSALALSAVVAL